MRRTRCYVFMLVMFLGVFQVGCAVLEQRSSLRTARDIYNTTLGALTELRAGGHLSVEAVERIKVARAAAWVAMDEWQECLETDQSVVRAIADWTEAMAVINDERLTAEGGE